MSPVNAQDAAANAATSTNIRVGAAAHISRHSRSRPSMNSASPAGAAYHGGNAGLRRIALVARRECRLGIAQVRLAEAGVHQHVGVVGIEHQRAFEVVRRFVVASPIDEDPAEHDLHHRIVLVERERAPRVFVREALLLVPLAPRPDSSIR